MIEAGKKRFSIGLEPSLLEWVKKKALQERRSVAGVISEIVRQAKESEEQQKIKE
ncbi:hypothetical protein SAMN02745130_02922 [Thiothrix eikelboomii]|jgi:hypothetical protein|uniref:Uncharacterized protein n=1 Tax=Thiothrix eikelboomii TaxID=92487 RepID=A0A1T4XGX3_9GAMM|nr:hypothetical protein [Thiothrix eikelboomii]SKA88321.1 hypothetical protein SAMN02745130_02922 [Thiothrix eikelboomii]